MMQKYFIVILVFVFSSGCLQSDSEQELMNKAENAFINGKLNEANLLAKNILNLNSKNGSARFIMAEIANIEGRLSDAEIDYQRALEAGHDINEVLPPYIETLLLLEKHNDIPALIENLPASMQAQKFYWLGLFYLADDYYDKAQNAFLESTAISTNSYSKPYIGKALIANALNDNLNAIIQLDKALAISPNDIDAKLLKAEILTKQNQDTLALPLLLDILKIPKHRIPTKKHFFAKTTLIQIYWRQQEVQLAEKHIVELLQQYKGNPIANYYGALINFDRGAYSQANKFLQQVLRASPEHTASLSLMGNVKYRQGFYEQADFYLSRALNHDQSNKEIAALLAATRLRQNQTTSAIELLDATSTQKSDPLILWLSGRAKIQSGDIDAGLALLNQAASISNNDEIQKDIAQTYLSLGRITEALSALDQLKDYNFANEQKDLFYIFDLIQQKKFDLALDGTEALIKKRPDNPFLQIALGKIYLATNQDELALQAFSQAKKGDALIAANLLIANYYLSIDNFALAEVAYNEILQNEADNFDAQAGLIRIAIRKNDNDSYQDLTKKLVASHPDQTETYMIQAAKALNEKNYQLTEELLIRTLQLDNTHVTAILLLATSYISNNKINPAILLLEDKTRLPELKNIAHLHFQLARIYQQNNNIAKAIRSYKTAFNLRPDNLQYLQQYTVALLKDQQIQLAQTVLQDFLVRSPKNNQAQLLLGDFYFSQNNFTEARKVFETAFKLQPTEASLVKLYRTLTKLGQTSASNILVSWLSKNPDSIHVRTELANFHLGNKNFNEAIKQFEALYSRGQINPAILNNLAWSYLQVGNRKAIDTAKRAYEIAPNSAAIIDTYGWILTNMGDPKLGLDLLEMSSQKNLESVEMQYHYAYALVKNGYNSKAQNLLNALLEKPTAAPFQTQIKQLLTETRS